MLTAGTPTDGSGANPPANNEDYTAAGLSLYDGATYRHDPNVPLTKTVTIGDNSPNTKTFLTCRPTSQFQPDSWQVVLHAWDTAGIAPGEHTLALRAGNASSTVTVTVP